MEMDLNNRLTEDETLEQAYDIFLELAVDYHPHEQCISEPQAAA